jgi:hypothetical protein
MGKPDLHRRALCALGSAGLFGAAFGFAGTPWAFVSAVAYVRYAYPINGGLVGAWSEFRRVAGPIHWVSLVVVVGAGLLATAVRVFA